MSDRAKRIDAVLKSYEHALEHNSPRTHAELVELKELLDEKAEKDDRSAAETKELLQDAQKPAAE